MPRTTGPPNPRPRSPEGESRPSYSTDSETSLTAGGLLFEDIVDAEGVVVPGVWLVVNPECAAALEAGKEVTLLYQIPKGHIEKGEAPEDTARREIEEEIGMLATAAELISTVERPSRKFADDGSWRPVHKRVYVYRMERVEGPLRSGRIEETPKLVPLTPDLLNRMYYTEEAAPLRRVMEERGIVLDPVSA